MRTVKIVWIKKHNSTSEVRFLYSLNRFNFNDFDISKSKFYPEICQKWLHFVTILPTKNNFLINIISYIFQKS